MFAIFFLGNSRKSLPNMDKLKIAKDKAIPELSEDGFNYEHWRSSYVAFYCGQIDTVMHIARKSDVKLENINADDAKMMTLTIFQCIHQNLRLENVGQQDLLANGYKLWKTLELRFQTVDQVARDIQRFEKQDCPNPLKGFNCQGTYLSQLSKIEEAKSLRPAPLVVERSGPLSAIRSYCPISSLYQ